MSWAVFSHYFTIVWPYILGFVGVPLAIFTAGHALINKREVHSAIGWVGVIVLVPLFGSLLYFLLGINRIRRRASRRFGQRQRMLVLPASAPVTEEQLEKYLPPESEHILVLNRLVENVVKRPLLRGNRILPLLNGDIAYPAMIEAIDNAEHSVAMETYIFDADEIGEEFRAALKRAVDRGIEVRVLIDAVGARYSWPPIDSRLRSDGVNAVRFLPTRLPWRFPYMNLRNHRKILVVDGKIGFTGGMNIRVGHALLRNPSHPVQDLHFRIDGPVVAQLQEAFTEDWAFSAHESLEGDAWFPPLEPAGETIARGIKDGPDEDFEKLRWALLGAISTAKKSIRVLTPYFLPDNTLITALNLAAMRGVKVEIMVPEKCNLALVQWASSALHWQVLIGHCELYASPPPFEHTKLTIIDRNWVLFGSTNWDPRSFRLNFEFNIESYDSVLAEALDDFYSQKLAKSRRITLDEVQSRKLPIRLRDGLARLFTPYL